jgi:hypothetical protein
MAKSSHIPISFWATDEQKLKIRQAAQSEGLKLSEYLRKKVLGDDYRDDTAA